MYRETSVVAVMARVNSDGRVIKQLWYGGETKQSLLPQLSKCMA